MNVKEIVSEYLIKNGYDGLFCDDCGCEAGELMPCDSFIDICEPGHKIPCNPETCGAGGDCLFHIGEKCQR
mgnify:CR=1 FL=1